MRQLLRRLWADDLGGLIATEWVFAATILVLGVVPGMKAVQSMIDSKLGHVAEGVGSINQSFYLGGSSGTSARSAGSQFANTSAFHPLLGQTHPGSLAATGCP
jgi:hypothetical protein